MNKTIFILALMMIAVSAIAFAVPAEHKGVMVHGKVTFENGTKVANASVTIDCTHNGNVSTVKVVTDNKGKYKYDRFKSALCDGGDSITVTAAFHGLTGTSSDVAGQNKDCKDDDENECQGNNNNCNENNNEEHNCANNNEAKIDVVLQTPGPNVPEFGLGAGAVSIGAAVLGMFILRRR